MAELLAAPTESFDDFDLVSTPATNTSSSDDADDLLQTDVGSRTARTVALALYILIGFVGNAVLVSTIAQSNSLKKTPLNLFLVSVAVVNLFDCILTLPLILGASVLEKWLYGDFGCQLNAFCLQLSSIVVLLTLMMMTFERFLSVKAQPSRTQSLSTAKANMLIIYCWVHGFGLSLVILIRIVPSKPFKEQYSCSISDDTNLVYICFVCLMGYALPLLLIILMTIYIIKRCVYLCENANSTRHACSDTTSRDVDILLNAEIDCVKLVLILLLFWCVCEGPYLLVTFLSHYKDSKQLSKKSQYQTGDPPGQVGTVCTWLRLGYVIALPIVSLLWCQEIRKSIRKYMTCSCQDDDLIRTIAPKSGNNRQQKQKVRKFDVNESRSSLRNKRAAEKDSKDLAFINGHVPVLFATANGLHYQTPAGKQPESVVESEENVTEADTTDTTLTQVLTSRKCDVIMGGEDDTSDYDSQIEDPFAKSNPISVASLRSGIENRSTARRASTDGIVETARYDTNTVAAAVNEDNGDDVYMMYEKRKSKNRRRTSESEAIETEKASPDSGRDSYGRSNHIDHLDQQNGNEMATEINVVSADPNSTYTQRRKRKKKKRKNLANGVGFVNKTECDVTGEQESSFQLQQPRAPRLLPKLNLQTDSRESLENTVANPDTNSHFVVRRPLPKAPTFSANRYARQQSEQPAVVDAVAPARRPRSAQAKFSKLVHDVTSSSNDRSESRLNLLENGVVYHDHDDAGVNGVTDHVTLNAPKKKRKKRSDL